MGMISEFKKFAMGGNLIDVAIAFVMGMAFNGVITAFTGGIVSPLLGYLLGVDLKGLKKVLRESVSTMNEAGVPVETVSEISVMYGAFIMALIDFIIIAFVCFMVIKSVLKKDPNAVPPTPANEVLLGEIRDLLKK
jgi:large conductance mechanosensitive channel